MNIKEEIARLNGLIARHQKRISFLKNTVCEHENIEEDHGGDSGNYDPTADCYWTKYTCGDCGAWCKKIEWGNCAFMSSVSEPEWSGDEKMIKKVEK